MKERIYFFDGIRGWAALIVLIGHVFNMFPFEKLFHNFYLRVVIDASLAVYIFFVLSGASLSYPIIKNYSELKIKKAILKRIPRLSLPILFFSFSSYLLMKCSFMYNTEAGGITGSSWLLSFYNFKENLFDVFTFSIYKVFFYYTEPIYNAVLWTMPHELFGSFFVFIFLLIFKKRLIWIPIIILSVYFLRIFNPIILCFGGGILISYLLIYYDKNIQSRKMQFFLFLLFCCIVYMLIKLKSSAGNLSIWSQCVFAFLFCFVFIFFNIFRKFFELSVSKYLGKISFTLYLVHLPVICSISSYLILKLQYIYLYQFIVAFITIFLSIVIAQKLVFIDEKSLFFSNKLANYLLDDDKITS